MDKMNSKWLNQTYLSEDKVSSSRRLYIGSFTIFLIKRKRKKEKMKQTNNEWTNEWMNEWWKKGTKKKNEKQKKRKKLEKDRKQIKKKEWMKKERKSERIVNITVICLSTPCHAKGRMLIVNIHYSFDWVKPTQEKIFRKLLFLVGCVLALSPW